MRKRLAVLLALIGSVVLWGEAIAGSGVPLQGVEVNRLTDKPDDLGFGDGPTPFPRPQPPSPTPTRPVEPLTSSAFIPVDRALIAWSQSATWWTRRADGALIFHDCLARAESKLVGTEPNLAGLVLGMQTHLSADLTGALAPWKESFREAIALEEEADMLSTNGDAAPLPIEEINQRWQRIVTAHAEEIAESAAMTTTTAGTCTTGRCDCRECPKKHTCDCQLYVEGADDCSVLMRSNCNVDDPPNPTRGPAPVLDTRDGF